MEIEVRLMDIAQLISLPANLLGVGLGFGASVLLDVMRNKKSGSAGRTDEDLMRIAKLEADLYAATEQANQVPELHAYSLELEAKIKELEAALNLAGTPENDLSMRVKVLEKQLAAKADVEAKLAIALQELDDLRRKASVFDDVVGTQEVHEFENPTFKPKEEPAEPTVEDKFESVVFADHETPAPAVEPAPAPKLSDDNRFEKVEFAPDVAVAQADPKIELVENPRPVVEVASQAGAAAHALHEAPSLRIEEMPAAEPAPITAPTFPPVEKEVKDSLEKIDGIGKLYQQKLYEAGIKTFAQLAAASPSRITEVIEPQNWQTIDVMKWRREAALFAAGEKS
jgi:predicted flap endonuclease-1-like 5' DNA nuclease